MCHTSAQALFGDVQAQSAFLHRGGWGITQGYPMSGKPPWKEQTPSKFPAASVGGGGTFPGFYQRVFAVTQQTSRRYLLVVA